MLIRLEKVYATFDFLFIRVDSFLAKGQLVARNREHLVSGYQENIKTTKLSIKRHTLFKGFVMKLLKTIPLFLSSIFLFGCDAMPGIKNNGIKERVIACAGGFNDSTGFSLAETFERTELKGDLSAEFKNHAQIAIFQEIPEGDRLSAYEDYIRCVKERWNEEKIHHFNKKNKEKKSLKKLLSPTGQKK